MIEHLTAALYGNEYVERMQNFDSGVSEIESKNSELFEEKNLSEHYMISTFQNNTVKNEFTESTLPPRIIKEVMDLFGSLFPKP